MNLQKDNFEALNPIFIPKILHNILQNLEVAELRKVRLLNTQWNEESCKLLHKKWTIVFNDVRSLADYILIYSKNCTTIPHCSYTFFFNVLKELYSDPRNLINLTSFFQLFGSTIKCLHLSLEDKSFDANKLFNLLSTHQLVNLETLSLIFCGCFEFKDVKSQKEPLILTKLKTLCINTIGYERIENVDHILQTILLSAGYVERISYRVYGIKCDDFERYCPANLSVLFKKALLTLPQSQLVHLQHLEIQIGLSNQDIQCLLTKDFPNIKFLNIVIQNDVEKSALSQFLTKFSTTLHHLYLTLPTANSFGEFPVQIPHLKFLSLTSFTGSLKVINNLPTLSKLVLRNFKLSNMILYTENLFCSDISNNNITSLQLVKCGLICPNLISQVSSYFPNLKRFQIDNVTDEVLQSVFEHMPNLLELEIEGRYLHDDVFCGIQRKFWDLATTSESPEMLRQYPYIGNLTKLQYLSIQSSSITELSILLGIIYCRQLCRLKIYSLAKPLSAACTKRLISHENLTNVMIHIESQGWHTLEMLRNPALC